MAELGIIAIENKLEVTGKGTVIVISLKRKDIKLADINAGDTFSTEELYRYEILAIEAAGNLFNGNLASDNIGLVVKKTRK